MACWPLGECYHLRQQGDSAELASEVIRIFAMDILRIQDCSIGELSEALVCVDRFVERDGIETGPVPSFAGGTRHKGTRAIPMANTGVRWINNSLRILWYTQNKPA